MFGGRKIKVSRQKIYDSLLIVKAKYNSFEKLCVYASYTPYQGLRMNVKPDPYIRRTCWMKDTLELTDCLKEKTIFDIANSIGTEIEIWIRKNNYQYDVNPDVFSDYIVLH